MNRHVHGMHLLLLCLHPGSNARMRYAQRIIRYTDPFTHQELHNLQIVCFACQIHCKFGMYVCQWAIKQYAYNVYAALSNDSW